MAGRMKRSVAGGGAGAALLVAALGLGGGAPAAAQTDDAADAPVDVLEIPEYARAWRLIDGPGVVGVMDLARAPETTLGRAIGVFTIQIEGRGVYEGVFNTRPGGLSLLGVFWREGEVDVGVVQGFLDIAAPESVAIARAAGVDAAQTPIAGEGVVSFMDGSPDISAVIAR